MFVEPAPPPATEAAPPLGELGIPLLLVVVPGPLEPGLVPGVPLISAVHPATARATSRTVVRINR